MNRGDFLWTVTMRTLMVFAVLCWLVVVIGVVLMAFANEPDAISMVIGVGVWAILMTIAAIGWRVTK